MILSDSTLGVLKNFALINSNIVFRQGNVVKTMSEVKNIMASATVEESFPADFGIYDLNEFLSTLAMFDKPDITFDEEMKSALIKEGNKNVKNFFSDISILTSPTKDVKMPEAEIKFTLTVDDLNSLRKAASALGVSDVVIKAGKDNTVEIHVTDIKDTTSNSFNITLDGTDITEEPFMMVFSISNLKFITGDYNVEISSKLISQFKNTKTDIAYFVALEKSSTFGQ
jgi:hypothetical protein